jgi:hypothetical protein
MTPATVGMSSDNDVVSVRESGCFRMRMIVWRIRAKPWWQSATFGRSTSVVGDVELVAVSTSGERKKTSSSPHSLLT